MARKTSPSPAVTADTSPPSPARPSRFGQPAPFPSIGGRVVEETTGLPLAGVTVSWMAPGSGRADEGSSGPMVELGVGRTDEDGVFEIASAETPEAGSALCGLSRRPDAKSHFVLDDGERALVFPAEPVEGEEETVIRISGGGSKPSIEQWGTLSAYLASNRMIRVDDVARQLSAPSADSPTAAWPVLLRAGAVAAAARPLSNDGESGEGADLLNRVHLVNLEALADGNVAKALTNYRDSVTFERFGGKASAWLDGRYFQLPQSDLELYRDYLRSVWASAGQRMYAEKNRLSVPTVAAFETQLETRFHQDFHTSKVAPKPAHGLLIPILRDVLMARADSEGFGLAAADVPVRGATQSDAEYVATLVTRTGKSAAELRNRFRVRFDRPLIEETSPVALNVEALLGLLADTYQSPEEPFTTALPGVDPQNPLIFSPFVGRAPFFLQFEEWLDRQRRFYPENVFDIRRTLPSFFRAYRDVVVRQKTEQHTKINRNNDFITSEADWHNSAKWVERMFGITDEIRAALAAADKQAYPEAYGHLDVARQQVAEARKSAPREWSRDDFVWFDENGNLPTPNDLKVDRRVSLARRAARPVTTRAELAAFETFFDTRTEPHVFAFEGGPQQGFYDWMESWLSRARTLYVNELDYFEFVLIPYLRSAIRVTLGDYAGASKELGRITGYELGVAEVTDAAGYLPTPLSNSPDFYRGESLPYTTAVTFDPESHTYTDPKPHTGRFAGARSPTAPPLIAPFEHRFFKLAQGEAMLAWADDLYRTDDPSAIRRARELYKGVLFMHGEDPGIAPHFPRPNVLELLPRGGLDGIGVNPLVTSQANPALTSQLARARAGFGQIELGLNAYGFRADMVPVLRYKPLKLAADLFGTSAKASQTDFLQYQTRFEQATIEGWQATAMVKKAEAGSGIAIEHIEIAKAGVVKAQEQVAAVKALIEAKRKEIDDADSFFGQAKSFFSGIKDSVSGLASAANAVKKDDSPATSVTNEQLLSMFGKFANGTAAGKEAVTATLGTGAALTMGFAAFAYYGYTTMDGMADASAKRTGDLDALQKIALPAAEAQVTLKARDVTIARFAQQIAAAELDLARAIDRYQRERFLNVDVWNKLAAFAQRTMKRYIELGARNAWLAERALAFEQNRDINIVRLNYVPTEMRGLTGADRLLLDLAELEANRLNGVRLTAPVKHTLSLARDFPIAFGQLKQTGRCTFHTNERALQAAYPGTFAYRVRAVTVAAHDVDGPPPRGILRNLGASTVSREDGAAPKLLVRFPDALPLSEFRLHQDLWVYGLPGEALLQFEGSGFETDWELEIPAAANPKGLRSLADVLITCDMNASYSQALATKAAAAPLVPVVRAIALAASVWDLKGFTALRDDNAPARLRFDLTRLALPLLEKNRVVKNLALIAVGKTEKVYTATLDAEGSGGQAAFAITDGLALSNAGPLLGAAAVPLPLNAMVDLALDQAFVLNLDRAGVEDELRALEDVVLWVEYEADL